jgi:hypothetical protein
MVPHKPYKNMKASEQTLGHVPSLEVVTNPDHMDTLEDKLTVMQHWNSTKSEGTMPEENTRGGKTEAEALEVKHIDTKILKSKENSKQKAKKKNRKKVNRAARLQPAAIETDDSPLNPAQAGNVDDEEQLSENRMKVRELVEARNRFLRKFTRGGRYVPCED